MLSREALVDNHPGLGTLAEVIRRRAVLEYEAWVAWLGYSEDGQSRTMGLWYFGLSNLTTSNLGFPGNDTLTTSTPGLSWLRYPG